MTSDAPSGHVDLHRHVVIVGMMASGKTTLGLALAAELGVPYVDNDVGVEAAADETGREIAEHQGVGALHALEADTLLRQLDRSDPSVIAAAASVVGSSACRAALADRATVCWIDVPIAELLRRLRRRGTHRRPMDVDETRRLHAARAPLFEEIADIRVAALDPLATRVRSIVDHLRAIG